MGRKVLHFLNDIGNGMTVGRLLMGTIFLLLPEMPERGILPRLFIRKVNKGTDESEFSLEHGKHRRHTGNDAVEHHTHEEAFNGIVPVVGKSELVASLFLGYLEKRLRVSRKTREQPSEWYE